MKNKQLPMRTKIRPGIRSLLTGIRSLLTVPCSLLTILLLFSIPCSLLPAFDLFLRPKAFAFIPMGSGNQAADGNARYDIGGGAEADFEIDFSSIWPNPLGLGYTAGITGGMLSNGVKTETNQNLQIFSAGGVLGLYYFPASRLFTRLDGAAGIYQPSLEGTSGSSDMFWRAGGEVGFRFTPGFTLALNSGWRQFTASGGALNSGVYVGLTAQITFRTAAAGRSEGVRASLDQFEVVYPAFMQLYQETPIGIVEIANNENAEVCNVRLYFRASPYTASEFPSGTVPFIARGSSTQLPLVADFSPAILRFSDSGRIVGELVIRYEFLGEEREAVRALSVAVSNRNKVTKGDAAALAAFISPTSPEVLDFSKSVAGLARANRQIGHNSNMQYAIWLFEALRAAGIRLGETYSPEDEAQFPAETLAYGSGASRDLALLFAAGLESVGIASAFVDTEDDFLVAVSLDVNQSGTETLFSSPERILIIDGNAWLPMSMGAFNEGFTAAWTKGASVLKQNFALGREAGFVIVEDAWAVYPPALLSGQEGSVIRTNAETAEREVGRAMQAYINQEILPLIQKLGSEQGASSAAGQNRMGILYARAGRISDAKASYERAAGMGSVPAMTNRGNLALTERDYAAAERWFRQALARDSQNKAALRGMEQVEAKR